MLVLTVVFICCMLIWLLGGGYHVYNGPSPSPIAYGTGTLLPWICVAILGYLVLSGMDSTTMQRPR